MELSKSKEYIKEAEMVKKEVLSHREAIKEERDGFIKEINAFTESLPEKNKSTLTGLGEKFLERSEELRPNHSKACKPDKEHCNTEQVNGGAKIFIYYSNVNNTFFFGKAMSRMDFFSLKGLCSRWMFFDDALKIIKDNNLKLEYDESKTPEEILDYIKEKGFFDFELLGTIKDSDLFEEYTDYSINYSKTEKLFYFEKVTKHVHSRSEDTSYEDKYKTLIDKLIYPDSVNYHNTNYLKSKYMSYDDAYNVLVNNNLYHYSIDYPRTKILKKVKNSQWNKLSLLGTIKNFDLIKIK